MPGAIGLMDLSYCRKRRQAIQLRLDRRIKRGVEIG